MKYYGKIEDEKDIATKGYVDDGLGVKVDKIDGKGLSMNDYTTAEKTKLAGIAEGANKTVVDSALSSTSTNPVQNKAVYAALQNAGRSSKSKLYSDTYDDMERNECTVYAKYLDKRDTGYRQSTHHASVLSN